MKKYCIPETKLMRSIITFLASAFLFLCSTTFAQSVPGNYVRTYEALAPEQDANTMHGRWISDVKTTTQYLDGLGRPVQTVLMQGSLPTDGVAADLVQLNVYDPLGRQPYKYMPFVDNMQIDGGTGIADGSFKIGNVINRQATSLSFQFVEEYNQTSPNSAEYNYYQKTNFEPSPLNRITEVFAPGKNWAGTESNSDPFQHHSQQVKYGVNTIMDDIKIWTVTNVTGNFGTYGVTGVYGANQLIKTITIDEHGKQVIEFKDKTGLILLKKVQLTASADNGSGSGYSGWLSTYYIYDDLNNLRCILPPKAVEQLAGPSNWDLTNTTILNELVFRNEYDEFGHKIKYKTPGAGEMWAVFDARDRLVLTQDANLRINHQWNYTKYDELNRPVSSGLITDPINYDNLQYHLNAAANRTDYPNTANYTAEELTNTFYDSYDWLAAYASPLSAVYTSNFDNFFSAASDVNWPYPQANIQSLLTKGMTTGSRIKVLGSTNSYSYTVVFYDKEGRAIQTQAKSSAGDVDIITTQYNWNGLPLAIVQKQEKVSGTAQNSTVITYITYDDLGRVVKTEKRIGSSLVNNGNISPVKILSQNKYNSFGRLIVKKLAPEYNNGAGLETMTYNYNVNGWLTGMNKDYLAGNDNHYFGFDLGYDKAVTAIAGTLYTTPQYDGSISGIVWRNKGDGEKRKYDYSYDAANRITAAGFTQYGSGGFVQDPLVNFNVNNVTYDANGNILTMNQKGLKINQSADVDVLTYNYPSNSNRLLNVIDASNDADTKLGDFRASSIYQQTVPVKAASTIDYLYDANGNLQQDLNKDITDIVYNYLNLPNIITLKTPALTHNGQPAYSHISNVYDAEGNKLRKQFSKNFGDYTITTTTDYLNGFTYKDDILQHISQEEGRIRFIPSTGTTPALFVYDYMLTDHLGNVRTVITDEQKIDKYPAATLESAKLATEKNYYDIQNGNIVDRLSVTGLPNYTNDNGIGNTPSDPPLEQSNSQKLYRLNAATGSKTGLGMTLKVMAGDRIDVLGKSYYFQNTAGTPGNSPLPVIDLLTAFLTTPAAGAVTAFHGVITPSMINTTPGIGGINTMLSQQDNESNTTPFKPRAFINVIFFDEQFKVSDDGFRISMIGDNSVLKDHFADLQNLTAGKSGYVYIYCSNESPVDVFFDNIQVVHTRGALLEENAYYPHGLKMAGICSKAFDGMQNNYQYQGDYAEFDEETQWTDFELRNYDAQVGRFIQQDPYDQFASPYTGMGNNPANFTDPSGGLAIRGNVPFMGNVAWGIGGAAIGAVIAKLSGGDANDVRQGAAIGGGIGLAASFVDWGAVSGALGDAASWGGRQVARIFNDDDWKLLYKSSLQLYFREQNNERPPTENELGSVFENLFNDYVNEKPFLKLETNVRRYGGPKFTGGDRNTVPDFIGDVLVVGKQTTRIKGSDWFELKQKGGGLYLSSNEDQIRGHIENLKRNTQYAYGKYGRLGYQSKLWVVTTADVKFSPGISNFAKLNNVAYEHINAEYRIHKNKWQFQKTVSR